MKQLSATDVHDHILVETHEFYRAHHYDLRDRGYHIMYGPLNSRPPILFVGYQPGGNQRTADHCLGKPDSVPPKICYYATEDWPLASWMKQMWGKAYLERCTGLNAIFFRSPKIAVYEKEVSRDVRQSAAEFCLPRVERMINAIEPRGVVFIGLQSLKLFGETKVELTNSKGRTLVESGRIGAIGAYSTLHLSGARISSVDRKSIAEFIRGLGQEP